MKKSFHGSVALFAAALAGSRLRRRCSQADQSAALLSLHGAGTEPMSAHTPARLWLSPTTPIPTAHRSSATRCARPGFLFGAQFGHNWQAPGSHWVWGSSSRSQRAGCPRDPDLLCVFRSGDVIELPRASRFHRDLHRAPRLCHGHKRPHLRFTQRAAPRSSTAISTQRPTTALASSRSRRPAQVRRNGAGRSVPASSKRRRRHGR